MFRDLRAAAAVAVVVMTGCTPDATVADDPVASQPEAPPEPTPEERAEQERARQVAVLSASEELSTYQAVVMEAIEANKSRHDWLPSLIALAARGQRLQGVVRDAKLVGDALVVGYAPPHVEQGATIATVSPDRLTASVDPAFLATPDEVRDAQRADPDRYGPDRAPGTNLLLSFAYFRAQIDKLRAGPDEHKHHVGNFDQRTRIIDGMYYAAWARIARDELDATAQGTPMQSDEAFQLQRKHLGHCIAVHIHGSQASADKDVGGFGNGLDAQRGVAELLARYAAGG